MNAMQVKCPSCQTLLRVNAGPQASRVRCPKCQTVLNVPAAAPVAPSADFPAADAPGSPPDQSPPAQSRLDPPFSDLSTPPSQNPFGDLPDVAGSSPPAGFQPLSGSSLPQQPGAVPSAAGTSVQAGAGVDPPVKSKTGMSPWVIVTIVLAVVLGAPILCCGVLGLIGMSRMSAEPAVVMTEGLKAVPVPQNFPDLGPAEQTLGGVTVHRVRLSGSADVPGSNMQMRIYMPAGEHADASLGCVLVAPAGTPLLHGADVDGGDYHDETLPYAQAGLVVIHYSIDGSIAESVNQNDEQAYSEAMAAAWPEFRQSGGGIVNGRNALEYALAKIKAVDPARISVAGHSSAGTLALMLAANEPRIKSCIAYAPAYDSEKRMADVISDPISRMLLPGVKEFLEWYTPIKHTDRFECLMMVCHAPDDGNVPFEDYERFCEKLIARRYNMTRMENSLGGHYEPMIREWIPQAVLWLSSQQ